MPDLWPETMAVYNTDPCSKKMSKFVEYPEIFEHLCKANGQPRTTMAIQHRNTTHGSRRCKVSDNNNTNKPQGNPDHRQAATGKNTARTVT